MTVKTLYKRYSSKIHGRGLFAKTDIEPDVAIIEYCGERITKKESERRTSGTGAKKKPNVYIFELNQRYDIDGDFPYNLARLINHSCEPNCESVNVRGHIWIRSIKAISVGQELTFNYGYSPECFLDNPCRCGSPKCLGYIVRADAQAKIRALLKRKKKTTAKTA